MSDGNIKIYGPSILDANYFYIPFIPLQPVQYITVTCVIPPDYEKLMVHLYRDSSKWAGDDAVCLCGELYTDPRHIRNKGVVCDFISTSCACGDKHGPNYQEQAEKDLMKRLATPGYMPTENEEYLIKRQVTGA